MQRKYVAMQAFVALTGLCTVFYIDHHYVGHQGEGKDDVQLRSSFSLFDLFRYELACMANVITV